DTSPSKINLSTHLPRRKPFCARLALLHLHSPTNNSRMRYLVTARVKPGRERALLEAIENRSLGQGSVAGDEYLRNMTDARLREDGPGREGKPGHEGKIVRWIEVCFCRTPLEEERPY